MITKQSILSFTTAIILGSFSLLATAQQTVTQDISVNLDPMVQISSLDDIILDPYNATTIVPTLWYNWEPFCIYSNNGNQFEFTVSGSGAGGTYEVNSGTDTIPFRTYFFSATDGVTRIFNGITSTFTGVNSTRPDCNGATTSWIAPAFFKTDLDAAPAIAFYTGTLFITVAPI